MSSIPIYEVPSLDQKERFEKQMESTSVLIGLIQMCAWLFAIVVCVMLLVVLLISTHFPSERKLISATVLGVLVVTLSVTLIVVRKNPNLSIIFSTMLFFVNGITFGVSIQYI